MNSKNSRDSKDPQPSSRNSARSNGGNVPYPSGAESHGQSKAEHVSPASRFAKVGSKPGPMQPTRSGGNGNVAASQAREDHGQRKAERVSAASRF